MPVYPKKTKALLWKDICTLTVIAALVVIAKILLKQPRWMDTEDVRYTHRYWTIIQP